VPVPKSVHQQNFGPIPECGFNLHPTGSVDIRAKTIASRDGTKVAYARTRPRTAKELKKVMRELKYKNQ
jgi:hypothetical protein